MTTREIDRRSLGNAKKELFLRLYSYGVGVVSSNF